MTQTTIGSAIAVCGIAAIALSPGTGEVKTTAIAAIAGLSTPLAQLRGRSASRHPIAGHRPVAEASPPDFMEGGH